MTLTRITAPAESLLTLPEVKDHLRIETADEDGYLTTLISAVESYLDGPAGVLGRALVTQTWRLDRADFAGVIALPLPPLQAVGSVQYVDDDGGLIAVDPSIYEVVTGGTAEGHIVRKSSQSWPTDLDDDTAEPVRITFTCGYGAASAVPRAIRQAALMLVTQWYELRQPVTTGAIVAALPWTVEALIAPYRVVGP